MKTLKELAYDAMSLIAQEGGYSKTNEYDFKYTWFELYERLRTPSAVNSIIMVAITEELESEAYREGLGMSDESIKTLNDEYRVQLTRWTPNV